MQKYILRNGNSIELFEHQIKGVTFLRDKKKAILADSMGIGKTRQAIVAAGEISNIILVVCPASLKINWKREIEMVYPDSKITILNTGKEEDCNLEYWKNPKWYIINYDILSKKIDFINELILKGMDTLILDESHFIKNKSIRSACVIGGITKGKVKFEGIANKMENVYCLTGTPLLNRPVELFNQLVAVGNNLGINRSFFTKRYCGAYLRTIFRKNRRPIKYMDESGATNLNELKDKLRGVMLRRKKEDVLDLPEKIISNVEVELGSEWRKTYNTSWDMYMEFLKNNSTSIKKIENIKMTRQLVEIGKLKQVCSLSKIDRIADDIENAIEQGERIIVFSQYTQTITDLKNKMIDKKLRCVTLTGKDSQEERQKSVDCFQNKEAEVFISNIKAGGVGLNLTEANIVMFADMEWSPEIHEQAIARAHRIGQKEMVNVYFYVALGTIEEDIIKILNDKKMNIDVVMGKVKEEKEETVIKEFLNKISDSINNNETSL